ncbi:hypothetical protein Unana1_06284 [Umbelopsis nana]
MSYKRPDAKPQAQYVPPGTQIVDRSSIFNDFEPATSLPNTSHLLDDMIDIAIEESKSTVEPASNNMEKPIDDAFEFKLFSNRPVTKVSIVAKEPEFAVTTRRPSVTQEITDEFQQRVTESAISFDEIMNQSRIPWSAMKMSHHVVVIPAKDPNENKKKRKLTKRQRDRLKAVRIGKYMRDPRAPGGWPGWPGERTNDAIITSLYGQLKHQPPPSKKTSKRPPKALRKSNNDGRVKLATANSAVAQPSKS